MKKIFAVSLLASFILVAVSSEAQVKFGPQIGLNLSKMIFKTKDFDFHPKSFVAYSVGVVSEFGVSRNIAIQPGILFSVKGTKYTGFLNEKFTFKPTYIEVPVNFIYQFDTRSLKPLLFAGPYFAYGIGGETTQEGGGSIKIQYGSDNGDNIKPFDFGLNLGAGIEVNDLQLKVQYSKGLLNLASDPANDTKMQTGVLSITLAYLFGRS